MNARDIYRSEPCPYCRKGLTPEALATHTRAECESVLAAWNDVDPLAATPRLAALRAVRWAEVLS